MSLAELIQAVLNTQECSIYGADAMFNADIVMADGNPIVGVSVEIDHRQRPRAHKKTILIYLSDKEA